MDSEGNKIKEKYDRAKRATEKCLASLRSIRNKKTKLVEKLIKKSDSNKMDKLKKLIGDL